MVISMQGWQRVIRHYGKKTCLFSGYVVRSPCVYVTGCHGDLFQLYIPTVITFSMLPKLEDDESEAEGWWKVAIVYVNGVINGIGVGGMYLAAW